MLLPSLSANASVTSPSTCPLLGNQCALSEQSSTVCLNPNSKVFDTCLIHEGNLGTSRSGSCQLTTHGLGGPCTPPKSLSAVHTISHARQLPHKRMICAASLNARCAEGQTQTVTRQSSTITIAPIQGKEKSPELDDGGTGLPPRDDDDGGGGGGGGGGPNWSGGFFFFGFLAFLGMLKDKESEGPYSDDKR